MNSGILSLALIFASSGMLHAQGLAAQQPATDPTVAEIRRMIAERERGNWREPIEFFSRFPPRASSMNKDNVAVWDAYMQMRVEIWFERSQHWKTRESVAADAERAVQAGQDYFAWYDDLPNELSTELPRTPANSPFAKVTAPGRIRFGVAIFGNALLELGRPREVLQMFAAMPDQWFGDEAFRIWVAAAASGSTGPSKETLDRVRENARAGRIHPEDITAFSDKLDKFLAAWTTNNPKTPPPPRWQSVRKDLEQIALSLGPIP